MNFLNLKKTFLITLVSLTSVLFGISPNRAAALYNPSLVSLTSDFNTCISEKYLSRVKHNPASGRIAIMNDEKISIYDSEFNLIGWLSDLVGYPYNLDWNSTGTLLAVQWIENGINEYGGYISIANLKIYELSTLTMIKSVKYEVQDITAPIVWSPNGERIGIVLGDEIALITYPSMEIVKISLPDLSGVVDLVWNPSNPNQFATTSLDSSLRIWDVYQVNPLRKIDFLKTDSLSSLAWKTAEPFLAVSIGREKENFVHIYHTESGNLEHILTGPIGIVNRLEWTHATLLIGFSDGIIGTWNAETGQNIKTIQAHASNVYSLSRNLDGSRIISSGLDRVIRVWDIATGTLIQTKRGFHGIFYSTSFSPDGTKVATTDHTPSFTTWSTIDGAYLNSYGNVQKGVASVSWSPDGTKIAAGGYDGKVYLWDSATQQLLSTLTVNTQQSAISSIIWKVDSSQFAVMQGKDAITFWNVANGQLIRTLSGQGSNGFFTVLWSPDGTKLATIGWDRKTLQLWDSTTGQELKKSLFSDALNVIEWNSISTQVVVGLVNKIIFLNLDLQVQDTITGYDEDSVFESLAWRNNLLLTIQDQNNEEIFLWDTDTKQVVSSVPSPSPREVKWVPAQNRFVIIEGKSICFYNNTRPDTPAIYRPTTSTFHFPTLPSVTFGNPNDHPITGDWNGDGVDTLGVFDPLAGRFQLRNSNTPGAPDLSFLYGNPGDIPLAGHWTATALHDGVGTYRNTNGTMYLFLRNQLSTGYADLTAIVGNPGDLPVVGDWNGDGVDTVGLYRPESTTFYLFNRNAPDMESEIQFTLSGGVPVAGRWTGSGGAGVGFFADGVFLLKDTPTSGAFDRTVNFGETGDLPLAGRWSP
jgi:WD40 repeat protein